MFFSLPLTLTLLAFTTNGLPSLPLLTPSPSPATATATLIETCQVSGPTKVCITSSSTMEITYFNNGSLFPPQQQQQQSVNISAWFSLSVPASSKNSSNTIQLSTPIFDTSSNHKVIGAKGIFQYTSPPPPASPSSGKDELQVQVAFFSPVTHEWDSRNGANYQFYLDLEEEVEMGPQDVMVTFNVTGIPTIFGSYLTIQASNSPTLSQAGGFPLTASQCQGSICFWTGTTLVQGGLNSLLQFTVQQQGAMIDVQCSPSQSITLDQAFVEVDVNQGVEALYSHLCKQVDPPGCDNFFLCSKGRK